MTEADRLKKICENQDKEIRRLRRVLTQVRIAHTEFKSDENLLQITITCIGIDDCGFIDAAKRELESIASAIIGKRVEIKSDGTRTEATDAITEEPLVGALNEQTAPHNRPASAETGYETAQ